jgi:hypothetical protein
MPTRGRIDRKKHEVDIIERVLDGGVWTPSPHPDGGHVTNLEDLRGVPTGTVTSAPKVDVPGRDPDHDPDSDG